jgi:hypothetical protein
MRSSSSPERSLRRRRAGFALRALAGSALVVGLAAFTVNEVTDATKGKPRLPASWERGANLTAFLPEAYAKPKARRAMLTLRATGADLVALTPTSYMETATASEIVSDPAKTPTDESVLTAARRARSLGFEVAIKPHVDVRDGTFRGEIQPLDRAAWFADYAELVERYASLAEEARAKTFVIGTELTSMSGDDAAWRDLIARARARFDGRITFAANWVEGAETITFWDALDAIGIDAYMPLAASNPEPSVRDLVAAWAPYVERIGLLRQRWGKPVLFTELGYESRRGTASRTGAGTAPIDEDAQADAYQAAFQALSPVPDFGGIWWWEWSAEGLGIGPGDGTFSPEGKRAALVLEHWQLR